MFGMDASDVVLLVVGGYLAVITLVQLMHRRREAMIENISRDVEIEKERLKEERKLERQQQAREEMEQRHREQLEKRQRDREERSTV